MKISPPCEASKWEMVLPPVFLAISNITDLPFSRKFIKQEDGLLLTSTGVIRCIAVQFCISDVLQPRGVHHLSVTVSYSEPSSKRRNVFIKAESCGLPAANASRFNYIILVDVCEIVGKFCFSGNLLKSQHARQKSGIFLHRNWQMN